MLRAKKEWKELPAAQVSDELLWEATKNYTSYLRKNNGTTLSTDPLNLSGLNTKRDSGVVAPRALGIDYTVKERQIKVKKAKKTAPVTRFNMNVKTKKMIGKKNLVELKEAPKSNNVVYSTRRNLSIRALVKSVRRDFLHYRRDLVQVALRRLWKLYLFKKNNKKKVRKDKKRTVKK